MQNAIYMLFGAYVLMVLTACADIRGLSGGKSDTQGPRIDSTRYSTPNKMTNFKEKEIILTFDEWVKLEQAQNRIIISPPLDEKPIIKLKHKSVVIRFQEELKPNTTYTINLADGVKDYTEGNIVEHFNYVFSTGDELDSLKLEGSVVDALSNEPKKGVWVMLYNNLADSTPVLERPYYLTKTKDDGTFIIENIKPDTYRIFALADKNNNYKYDPLGEDIAYWKEPFLVEADANQKVMLRMFTPTQELKLMSHRFANKGTMRFMWNRSIEKTDTISIEPLFEASNFERKVLEEGDSVYVWFKAPFQEDSTYQFLVQGKDTVNFLWGASLAKYPTPKLITKAAGGKSSGKAMGRNNTTVDALNRGEKEILPIYVNVPIQSIDSTLVGIYKDSIAESTFVKNAELLPDSNHVLRLNFMDTLLAGDYILAFMPGAIVNYFDETNPDTLKQAIKVLKPVEYGRMEVIIQPSDSLIGQHFVMQLYKGADEVIFKEQLIIQDTNPLKFNFTALLPGTYSVRLVYDNNQNGKWDTGSYWLKTDPEKILNSANTQVRADWDNELLIDLNTKQKMMKGK